MTGLPDHMRPPAPLDETVNPLVADLALEGDPSPVPDWAARKIATRLIEVFDALGPLGAQAVTWLRPAASPKERPDTALFWLRHALARLWWACDDAWREVDRLLAPLERAAGWRDDQHGDEAMRCPDCRRRAREG